jgi:CRP-like cAMP-binding protein
MVKPGSYPMFLRATFGIEPGGEMARQFSEIARQMRIRRGESVETDPAEATLVFLTEGATKLSAIASRGRHQIVAFHFGGDIFSVPPEGLHRHVLTGLTDCALTLFPAQAFYDRAGASPRIMRALLDRSQTALFRCRDKAVNLGRKSASERVAGFLLGMAERLECPDDEPGCIELPMSRRDVGESIGLTIETVSRQLTELKEAGIIDTRGRACILIKDLPRLAEQAGNVEPREQVAGEVAGTAQLQPAE